MADTSPAHYLFQKRCVFYFSRHVPQDVRDHYKTKRIVFSLKTKSETAALKASRSISQRLEDYWMSLRLTKLDIPAQHLVREQRHYITTSNAPLLSEALETYLRLKGSNKRAAFSRPVKRISNEVIELLGNKPIDKYSTSDAAKFRDHQLSRGLNTSSVKRNLSTIRAIFNLTICEQGIDCRNAFSNIYIPDLDDVNKRKPIPLSTIRAVQKECCKRDDDQRWLIALLSDTGMRLSEAVGLHIDDFKLDEAIPHLIIRPHPWRLLKTKRSEREIPLVGMALWATTRILANSNETKFAFPRYTNEKICNGNSASAALNKWLRPNVPDKCVIHSFRHSMRDRLRAVECPSEIIDQIGGWTTNGVGNQYGSGFELNITNNWMKKILD